MAKIRKSPDSPKHLLPKIYNHQKALPIQKRIFSRAIREIFSYLQKPCEGVSVYFVTKKEIAALHEQFFQDPTPTDCITFPPFDIVVCPSVAIVYAKKRKTDPFAETLLYVVHGILHLLGFDDVEPAARKTMRKMEKKCMAYLKTKGFFN